MKQFFIILSLIVLVGLIVSPAWTSSTRQQAQGQCDWEVPIAAGLYYPHKGQVASHGMRYYRVRCWPGCHTGSSLGVFQYPLEGDQPVFPTSTIDLKAD